MINWKGELVDQDSNKKTFDQLKRGSSSLSNKFHFGQLYNMDSKNAKWERVW
jgi:hypothetical protein